jgi:N,N'-diacetyllegionaminate synthase
MDFNKVIIIAEAGVNHNGNINVAKQLIDVAVDAGADFVKFQTFKAKNLATKKAPKADYQEKTTGKSESQLEMLKRLELSEENHVELIEYCKERQIEFLSTAFDSESIKLLTSLGITLGKIPSGELTNLPYLREMSEAFSSIILSTGMANMAEIEETVDALLMAGTKRENLTVLHCNTEYPTPFQDVNLKAMLAIQETIGLKIGYSDHTLGIEVPIAAVAFGATVIEKHFTLDRSMEGPDHQASLEPSELKAMVSAIRNIELAIGGSGEKEVSQSERKNINIARKSIVAAVDIKKGTNLTENNLAVKRPGAGINPMKWDEVIGTIATKDFAADDLIEL